MIRILGVDPGSRVAGFGLIEISQNRATYLASGCIRVKGDTLADRLKMVFDGFLEVVETFQPDEVAIESVFMHRNADSALKLGQARGAAIAAIMTRDLSVFEYSPTQIKKSVVGRGHADKTQVQHMVRALLKLPDTPQADAADALACALCHQQSRVMGGQISQAKSRFEAQIAAKLKAQKTTGSGNRMLNKMSDKVKESQV